MNLKKTLFVIVFLGFSLPVFAKSNDILKQLSQAQNVPALTKKQGYVMVYVNVSGVAPSIEFSKVNTHKTSFILSQEKISYGRDYFLDLQNIKQGFYFMPMFAGVYQITRVNAPFYDLPYWLPTDKESKWRFAVEENHINFIGEINIAKERGKKTLNIHLLNRTATYHAEIIEQIALMSQKLPLKAKPGYRDDFLLAHGE
ncbi:MAG: hypothetical protein QF552_09860 [Litorilituus sp.]|jgi:hypothetical protein|nr:hypothetical protein [Litorilituus sp.]